MAVGCVCFLWGLGMALVPSVARGEVITLKNGYQLEGKIGRLANIAPNPLNPSSGGPELIVLVDDELRRMFVPFYQVKTFAPPTEVRLPGSINVEQRVASGGSRITSVGVPLRVTPFDEYGRRTYSMQTSDGPIHIIQGMTRVTPTFIQLKGLVAEKNYIWETKIPTSSVSAELLSKILRRQAGDDPDMRQAMLASVAALFDLFHHPQGAGLLQAIGELFDIGDLGKVLHVLVEFRLGVLITL